MSPDFLAVPEELELLRVQYQAQPHPLASVTVDRVTTAFLKVHDPWVGQGSRRTWLSPLQLKHRQKVERPASPEHFGKLEMVGAIRDTYFRAADDAPSRRQLNPDLVVHKVSREGLCMVEECGEARQARGYCAKHYQRWLRHGDPEKVMPRRNQWNRDEPLSANEPMVKSEP